MAGRVRAPRRYFVASITVLVTVAVAVVAARFVETDGKTVRCGEGSCSYRCFCSSSAGPASADQPLRRRSAERAGNRVE